MTKPVYLAAGLRTPFARVDGELSKYDALAMSVPVMKAMQAQLGTGDHPDAVVWGSVAANLAWSNIAREVMLDAGIDPHVPARSTVLACSTSMVAAFEGAAQVQRGGADLVLAGGSESMSRVQIGLSQRLSDWIRRFGQARSFGGRVGMLGKLPWGALGLYIPKVANRSTGLSMGEHTELMAKEWQIARSDQDAIALASHQNAVRAQQAGFFDSLITAVDGHAKDTMPRPDTSAERLAKLKPAFDRSAAGTLTAGNSSPLTDGAAGLWVASTEGMKRLPGELPRVELVDFEMAAVNLREEGLLMAPAYAVPRLLARQGLSYGQIDLWEIHEAFAAQVLANLAAFDSAEFRTQKAGVSADLGQVERSRINPNGGSLALGHPFGATGARILSQAVKELATRATGSYAVVSICADGGQGTVALLRNAGGSS